VELLPGTGESKEKYYRRQVGQLVQVVLQNQEQNNLKLTYLAVAHTALKNFIVGVVIFASVAGAYRLTGVPSDELVRRLKTDRVLREFRGLEGARRATDAQRGAGPTGRRGPTCQLLSAGQWKKLRHRSSWSQLRERRDAATARTFVQLPSIVSTTRKAVLTDLSWRRRSNRPLVGTGRTFVCNGNRRDRPHLHRSKCT
jgi:hypothetical protein